MKIEAAKEFALAVAGKGPCVSREPLQRPKKHVSGDQCECTFCNPVPKNIALAQSDI